MDTNKRLVVASIKGEWNGRGSEKLKILCDFLSISSGHSITPHLSLGRLLVKLKVAKKICLLKLLSQEEKYMYIITLWGDRC